MYGVCRRGFLYFEILAVIEKQLLRRVFSAPPLLLLHDLPNAQPTTASVLFQPWTTVLHHGSVQQWPYSWPGRLALSQFESGQNYQLGIGEQMTTPPQVHW